MENNVRKDVRVCEIANVTNDPESGKFWLLYVGAANSSEPLTHLTNDEPNPILYGIPLPNGVFTTNADDDSVDLLKMMLFQKPELLWIQSMDKCLHHLRRQ
ncbi:unnamed protein product [Larinioides sclopetarius]|uniref:Uncharacterized protein n=1 Tax=Larinioides sclopetarius TaxID=280406 RepID=A0AAV2BVJ0_9ARAC